MGTLFRFVHSATLCLIPSSFERRAVPPSKLLISAPSLCKRRPSPPFPSAHGCSGEESCFTEVKIRRKRTVEVEEKRKGEEVKGKKIILYSVVPFPLLFLAALPGAETLRSAFGPFVELVKTWNLPEWLVHWGHPGNMAVVLFAMGGYGSYLGFRIRLSKDAEEKAMAKDLHPKLLAGMFFFFALGATGGITALLTSDKPILESPHAVSGLMGLSMLTIQTILPALFEDYPGLRIVHGLFGSSIMALFLIHAALGLQLGLSF